MHLKQQSRQFGLNIGQMLERQLTFAEALADTGTFHDGAATAPDHVSPGQIGSSRGSSTPLRFATSAMRRSSSIRPVVAIG